MANSEKAFKKALVTELREYNRHVYCTRDFGNGIPDLYVRAHQGVWIELKFAIGYKRPDKIEMPLKLSALQRKFIRDEQKAGGYAGWMLCVKDWSFEHVKSNTNWLVFTGIDANVESVLIDEYTWARGRGEQWGANYLVDKIISEIEFVKKKAKA